MKTFITIATIMFKFSLFTIDQKSTCEDIEDVRQVKKLLKEEYKSNLMSEEEFKQEWEKWDELYKAMYYHLFMEVLKVYE